MLRTDERLARRRESERRAHVRKRAYQEVYWQEWAARPGARERRAEQARQRRTAHPSDYQHAIAKQAEWQAISATAATVFRAPWSPEDDVTVMRADITLLEIALNLGRTYAAVKRRRGILARNDRERG